MTQDAVLYAVDVGVARVTLNRPNRRNAIDLATMKLLGDRIEQAAADTSVGCIVLDGTGDSFCAGGDLGAGMADVVGAADEMLAAASRAVSGLVHAPQPVITAVDGPAVGVGASLALASDLVIATTRAHFILPFAGIGLIPDGGATATLAASVGRARAMRILLLRERVTAGDALAAGLVSVVCDPEDLEVTITKCSADLVAAPWTALSRTKAFVNEYALAGLDRTLEREAEEQADRLASLEFREAIEAFTGRRVGAAGTDSA